MKRVLLLLLLLDSVDWLVQALDVSEFYQSFVRITVDVVYYRWDRIVENRLPIDQVSLDWSSQPQDYSPVCHNWHSAKLLVVVVVVEYEFEVEVVEEYGTDVNVGLPDVAES